MKRYAIVRNARSLAEAEAYLPNNYKIIHEYATDDPRPSKNEGPDARPNTFVIEGEDDHGWTLDGYVIPRYASGLIWAEEIDLSHPIMKTVPDFPAADIVVLLNETEDDDGRLAIFARYGEDAYQDGDVLTAVWKGRVFGKTPEALLETVFGMFNRGAPDFVGDVVYPHRSLSVGDCVRLDGILYACENVGWKAREEVAA